MDKNNFVSGANIDENECLARFELTYPDEDCVILTKKDIISGNIHAKLNYVEESLKIEQENLYKYTSTENLKHKVSCAAAVILAAAGAANSILGGELLLSLGAVALGLCTFAYSHKVYDELIECVEYDTWLDEQFDDLAAINDVLEKNHL